MAIDAGLKNQKKKLGTEIILKKDSMIYVISMKLI